MTLRAVILLILLPLALSSCGGIADSVTTHELTLHVSRHGNAASSRSLSVAMRPYENVPFTDPQRIATDPRGSAHAEFKTMWGAAFFIIPPVGSVPSRPPKPVYAITVGNKRIIVSPETRDVTYRWEHDSWHTDASISLP